MEINKKTWAAFSLHQLKKNIDTNPDYQRPAVWTKAQKQLLIDTILHGYDVPKLYFRKISKNPEKFDVVDGQQRLRAIWGFMDDEYPIGKDCDPINGVEVAGKKYSELDLDIHQIIDMYQLDVVVISESSEDEVRDLFLRLQNGTNLKAQEKRNAMSGKMRDFCHNLTTHPFFEKSVSIKNVRFLYDLLAAQMCLVTMNKGACNVKDANLNKLYIENMNFDENSKVAKDVTRTLDLLFKIFPSETLELKRPYILVLFILAQTLLNEYAIKGREQEVFDWFIDFVAREEAESKKSEDEQDKGFFIYHEKAQHSTDTEDSLDWRYKFLLDDLFVKLPNVQQKDPQRLFDEYQRKAIFRKNKGICQICGKECTWNTFQADHILAWNKGGATTVENGQVLCQECNAKKSDN